MIYLFVIIIFKFSYLNAHEIAYADSHGPISIMGDHTHKKNDFMFSYRFMSMQMNNIKQGTKKVNSGNTMRAPNGASDGSGTYMNAPEKMSMDMHMFGAMYAPLELLTVMIMTSYNEKEMTSRRMPMAGGAKFDVNSSGFGDLRSTFLINTYNSKSMKNHVGLGMSFPTGSINKRDRTPMSNDARLGYGMQNGTGTFDGYILFNNLNNFGKFKLGEQIFFKMPVSGKNNYGYRYGKEIDLNLWLSYRFLNNLSSSFKVNYQFKDEMIGSDNEMNKRMSIVMDSKNQGFQKINLGFGINLVNHKRYLKNHRLALEIIVPVYEKFKGLQMSENFRILIGWQY